MVVVGIVPIAGSKDDSDFSNSDLDESGERWMGVSFDCGLLFLTSEYSVISFILQVSASLVCSPL